MSPTRSYQPAWGEIERLDDVTVEGVKGSYRFWSVEFAHEAGIRTPMSVCVIGGKRGQNKFRHFSPDRIRAKGRRGK
jgi:hypothetical protein